MMPAYHPSRSRARLLVLILSIICVVGVVGFSLAQPTWGEEPSVVSEQAQSMPPAPDLESGHPESTPDSAMSPGTASERADSGTADAAGSANEAGSVTNPSAVASAVGEGSSSAGSDPSGSAAGPSGSSSATSGSVASTASADVAAGLAPADSASAAEAAEAAPTDPAALQEEGSLSAQAETVSVSTAAEFTQALNAGGEKVIDLAADITLGSEPKVPAKANITITSSAGKTLKASGRRGYLQALEIGSGATLTLGEGLTYDANGMRAVYGPDRCTLVIDGATIKNGSASTGNNGVICLYYRSTFELRSGSIESSSSEGSIVYLFDESRGIISGGTIANNSVGTPSTSSASKRTGTVFVGFSSTLEMSGGSISYNSSRGSGWSESSPGVRVAERSSFTMSGGSIDHNDGSAYYTSGGGIYASGEGTSVTMTGGRVADNTVSYSGGGVALMGGATFTMSGDAVIEGNKAPVSNYYGGGIFVYLSGKITIEGGSIKNNYAKGAGGGIYLAGADASLTMTGGSIANNVSASFGGGVYLGADSTMLFDGVRVEDNQADAGGGVFVGGTTKATFLSGYIVNNKAVRGAYVEGVSGYGSGGGINVANYKSAAILKDALITANYSGQVGGGAWFCPTGDVNAEITDGAAMYGNEAAGAGDDLSITHTDGQAVAKSLVNPRMLAGGPANWHLDGETTSAGMISGGGGGYRYRDGRRELFDQAAWEAAGGVRSIELKAVPNEASIELARQRAKLFIENNRAENGSGGGIASNGHLSIGSAETKRVAVKKAWNTVDGRPGADSVVVYLEIDDQDGVGRQVESATLSEANNWSHVFEGLPPKSRVNLQEAEMAQDGWVATYHETFEGEATLVDAEGATIPYFELENVTVSNAHVGSLAIAKKVVGTSADRAREYAFQVTILDPMDEEPYEARDEKHHPVAMDFSYATSDGRTGTLKGGTGTITLTDGQTATVTGLPHGALYRVDEVHEPSANQRVSVERDDGVTGQAAKSGTIAGEETRTLTFTNDFEHKPATLVLEAAKTLEGRPLVAGEFSFDLVDAQGFVLETASCDENGIVRFGEHEFGDEGEYIYFVRETTEEAGVTDDAATHRVTVTVEDIDGELVATPTYERDGAPVDALAFENVVDDAPKFQPVSIELEATKTLAGSTMEAGQFSFRLDDGQSKTLQTKANDANGIIRFDALSFDQEGTYAYTVTEAGAGLAGERDDAAVHVVSVQVTADADGALQAAVTITRDGEVVEGLSFQNEIVPEEPVSYTPATARLVAVKTLEGAVLEAGRFSFHLVDGQGTTLETKTNDEHGVVLFDELSFTEPGTYAYQVVEDKDNPVVAYDGLAHVVTFQVRDAGGGILEAQQVVTLDGKPVDLVAFDNVATYEPIYDELSFSLRCSKVLEGRALKDGEFEFALDDVHGQAFRTQRNAADGSVSFDGLTVSQAGTYVYRIAEVAGSDQSVRYDGRSYLASVRVEAGDDGKLAVSSVSYLTEEQPRQEVEAAVFTNVASPNPTPQPFSGGSKQQLANTADPSRDQGLVTLAALAGIASLGVSGIARRARKRSA